MNVVVFGFLVLEGLEVLVLLLGLASFLVQ